MMIKTKEQAMAGDKGFIKAIDFEFLGEVDDCWIQRWSQAVVNSSGGSTDDCFAALRVTFTLNKDQAIKLLGADNLPAQVKHDLRVSDKLPRNGETWALARVKQ
jgi:hypothetical protein